MIRLSVSVNFYLNLQLNKDNCESGESSRGGGGAMKMGRAKKSRSE